MRIIVTLLGLLFLAGMIALGGCNGEQAPVKTAGTDTPETEDEGNTDKNGEEETDPEEEVDDGPIPFNRLWPNDPRSKEVLLDPENNKVTYSYWRDAKVGDWVRFLTYLQKLCIYEVIEREGANLKYQVRHFELTGEEIPKKEPDIRKVDIAQDDKDTRGTLIGIPFLVRTIYDWPHYKSSKILLCERRNVDNPTGENNETCSCREIRCGGYVFQRRGNTTVVRLIDFGDAANPPKWDHLKPVELLNYWHKLNKFIDDPYIPQEDSPEGELPEMPEDPPPVDTTGKLNKLENLVGPDLSKALADKQYKDAVKSLDQVKLIIEDIRAYAQANNFVPALKEVGKVSAKADELHAACGKEKAEEASRGLGELRELLDILYISVKYKKELK